MEGHRSGLYASTGNVNIYRVSEETRRKVQRQTKCIKESIERQNQIARQKHRKEEHERALLYEHERDKMINRWKSKYVNSPYKVQNFRQELQRIDTMEERENRQREHLQKHRLVESMTGEYIDPYVSKETIRPLSTTEQLALQYRKHLMDESKVNMESEILERLAAVEYHSIELKFPKLKTFQSTAESQPSSVHSTGSSLPTVEPRRLSSRGSRSASPRSSLVVPEDVKAIRKLLSRKSLKLGQNFELPASDSATVSLDGPLEYTSPTERMTAISDDISLEFATLINEPVHAPSSPPTNINS